MGSKLALMGALLAIVVGFVSVGSIIRSVSVTGHNAPLSLADFEVAGSTAKPVIVAAAKLAEPAKTAAVTSAGSDVAPPPPPAAVVPQPPVASAGAAPPATHAAANTAPPPAASEPAPVAASQQIDPVLAQRAAKLMNDTNSAIDRILPNLSNIKPVEPAKSPATGVKTAAAEPPPAASVDAATKPHVKSAKLRRQVRVTTLIPRHKPVRLARAKSTYVHRVRAAAVRHLTTQTVASNRQVMVRVYLGKHVIAVHVPAYPATADAGSGD